MKTGINTKVCFWAKKCGFKWKDNRARILNNKILKVEGELEKIRNYLFENFTDFNKSRMKRRKHV